MTRSPYPGLRPFRRDEADLFFGRDDEIDGIVDRLTRNRFLGVLGASGSGKSSLVRTGLFEALQGGTNIVGSAWQIVDCHPGGSAIAHLAAALAETSAHESGKTPDQVEEILRRGPRSVVEWCEAGNLAPGTNLLILIDQFEELFNYPGSAARGEAQAFASLLVESARSDRAPIFVVLTMRSDYFGACGAYPELARTISESIFLTSRMLREQCREAIELPSAVAGFEIAEELLSVLLNDLEKFVAFAGEPGVDGSQQSRQADQLPLMQYALNRMWKHAVPDREGRVRLTNGDYARIGGLAGAIDQQGYATIDSLACPEAEIERLFRTLIKGPSVALATRNPQRVSEIAAISELSYATIVAIVGAFAAEDCQFLRVDRPIGASSYVDISHESLIRQWGKLAGWLKCEADAAETWRHTAANASEWNEHGREIDALLSGSQLVRRREWWENEHPTQAWADRYAVDAADGELVQIGLVQDYIAVSVAQQEAEQAAQAQQRRRRLIIASGIGMGAFVAVGVFAALQTQNYRAKEQIALRLLDTEKGLRTALALAQRETMSASQSAHQAARSSVKAARQTGKAREETQRASASEQRAVQLAIDARQSEAMAIEGKQAFRAATKTLLAKLHTDQDTVGDRALSRATIADDMSYQLFGPHSALQMEMPDVARGFDLVGSNAVLDLFGTDLHDDHLNKDISVVDYVRTRAARLRGPGAGPADVAQAWLLDGNLDELQSDFPAATAAYDTALAAAPKNSTIAFQVATAMVRLRQLGIADPRLGPAVALCATSAGEQSNSLISVGASDDPDDTARRVAAQQCRAEVAALWLLQDKATAANLILDALAQIDWHKDDKSRSDRPETVLSRLRLRARIAILHKDWSYSLLNQAKLQLDANPGTEQAISLYAGLQGTEGRYRDAFMARRSALDRPDASTGFLLDALSELRQFDQADAAASSDATQPSLSVGSIREQIEAIGMTVHLIDVAQRLERRHAPEPPAMPDAPIRRRSVLIDEGDRRLDDRLRRVEQRIRDLANWMNLFGDVTRAPDTHLTSIDQRQIAAVHQLILSYDESCLASVINAACSRSQLQLLTQFKPLFDAKLSPRLDSAATGDFSLNGEQLDDEPDIAFNGYDLVAYGDATRSTPPVPQRGRNSVALPDGWQGRTLLFASAADRETFRLHPHDYLPAFDGNDIDWLAVGAAQRGDPRFACHIGGQLLFLSSAARQQALCHPLQPVSPELRRLIANSAQNWRSGIRPRSPLTAAELDPVPGAQYTGDAAHRDYTVGARQKIILPAAARIVAVNRGFIAIRYADGSTSLYRFALMANGTYKGEFTSPPERGEILPSGTQFQFRSPTAAGDAELFWQFVPTTPKPAPRSPIKP